MLTVIALVLIGLPLPPHLYKCAPHALQGWIPLMRAWVDLKTRQDWYVDLLDHPESEADSGLPHQCLVLAGRDRDRHRRTLRNACLVLAGPDPRAIADDPEGLEVRDSYLCDAEGDLSVMRLRVRRGWHSPFIVSLPLASSNHHHCASAAGASGAEGPVRLPAAGGAAGHQAGGGA